MLRVASWAVFGASVLQFCEALPGWSVIVVVFGLGVLCIGQRGRPWLHNVAAALLGFAAISAAAISQLSDRLSPSLVGTDITLVVQIIDFPHISSHSIRFIGRPLGRRDLPARVRLSWYDAARRPAPGETWRLRVRLKRPRGLSNVGGFDSERYLHRQKIGASGYVLRHRANRKLDTPTASVVDRLRTLAVRRIDRVLPAGDASAVIKAISVGARGDISDQQWRLYARTGTSHLMAISGLHIGLAAAAASGLAWIACGVLMRRRNVRDMALLGAAAVAGLYSLLSGWAVPAQRAFLMLLLAALAVLVRRRVSAGHVLGFACLAVLATEPLAVYAPGFLLSFGAVCILLWRAQALASRFRIAAGGSRLPTILRELFLLQWLLFFGLLPLTVLLFGRLAWLAPAVNLLALPVFNLLTVPLALLGLLLAGPVAPLGDLLLRGAWWSTAQLLGVLAAAGDLPHASVEPAVSGSAALLICAGSLLYALLPPGCPGRHLALLALLATLNVRPSPPPTGCFDLRVFDVGQGLSVSIRTADYVLLYDTGPAYRGGGNAARSAIGPWITRQGLRKLDTLIVSHADLDHIGGAAWLESRVAVVDYLSGEPTPPISKACRAGQAWRRDGVQFSVLHPAGDWSGNNASCVLSVSVGDLAVLLTGDIEAPAERSLLDSGRLQPVDLALVPHHGSRTSSGEPFIGRILPRVAVVSTGFGNRWGFPKGDVVRRWQAAGAEVFSTADHGAIGARYCAGQPAPRLRFERQHRRRYWHD